MSKIAHFRALSLQKPTPRVNSYTGVQVEVLHSLQGNDAYQDQEATLTLLVVARYGLSLLGHDWFKLFRLDYCQLHVSLDQEAGVQEILNRHHELFRDKLGKLVKENSNIYVDSDGKTLFCCAHEVPCMLKEEIKAEFDCLVK